MGPLGPDLQDLLDLSELQLAMMIAVPVLLGSLMRIPLGILDRPLRRAGASSPALHGVHARSRSRRSPSGTTPSRR